VTEQLQRYNIFRFFVSLGILGWAMGISFAGGWSDGGTTRLFRVCAVALFVLLLTTLWTRRHAPTPRFVLVQLALDVALATVLSAYTGGRHSFFIYLFFPAIAAGAWLLRMRGALIVAGLASVGFVAALAIRGEMPPADPADALLAYSETMFRVLAFFLIAILTGQLGESLARAGQALQEERFTTLVLQTEHGTVLDRVRAGVVTTDAQLHVVSMNPFAQRLLGDVRGASLPELFPGRVAGGSWEERRGAGGHWICSEASLPDGGHVLVVDDVTELERMRSEASRNERLVSAGRLAAGLAHEIRNPLASLSGSLQLLRESGSRARAEARLLDLALGEADRLNRLVDDFLGIATRPSIVRQPCDPFAIARDVCDAFARDPRYNERTRVACEGESALLRADPDRLRQALWNLLLNGAQAMPRGGTVRVSVRPAPAAGTRPAAIEFVVEDEGVGIAPDELARVFDPFWTSRTGGTGLGLALVDKVVRGHGGSIAARPRDAGGTSFVFWIPRDGP
jgi:two-component system sensor histidine kinase PilS (NtrC family)